MWIIPKNYKLSSAFAQGMVESKEDLRLLGSTIECSLMWRSKPSQLRTWLIRWKKVSWIPHLFTRILKPSHQKSFEEQLTLSLGAILVSRLAKLAKEKVKKIQDTSGHTSENTSIELDLPNVSLKTSKDTSRLDSPQLSATWKKMVTKQRGVYSLRKKSERATKEKECLLKEKYPTPSARDYRSTNNYEATLEKIKKGERAHMGQLPNYIMVKEKSKKLLLNPNFVEALMGLPQGWTGLDVTDTEMKGTWADDTWEEGIPRVIEDCANRKDRIRLCGNGVVPQTAAKAWQMLDR